MRRALLCDCGCRLEAGDEEELVSEVLAHLRWEHPVMGQRQHQEAQIHERVVRCSYRYECMEELYTGGAEPDDEFGLDPY